MAICSEMHSHQESPNQPTTWPIYDGITWSIYDSSGNGLEFSNGEDTCNSVKYNLEYQYILAKGSNGLFLRFTRILPMSHLFHEAMDSNYIIKENFLDSVNPIYAKEKKQKIFWIIQNLNHSENNDNKEKINQLILNLHFKHISSNQFKIEYLKLTLLEIVNDDDFLKDLAKI